MADFLMSLAPVFILFVVVTAGIHGDTKLSEYLWEQTNGEREAALNASVIQGMKTATLNPAKFGAYMVQDAVYLFNSHRLINVAAERATNLMYKDLLKNMSDEYTVLYEYRLKHWNIKYPSGIRLDKACSKYLHDLYHSAVFYDTGYFITAMLPCYKLWPWLGAQLGAKQKTFGLYTEWVEVNLDPDNDSYLELEEMINRAEEAGYIDRQVALRFFRRSMQNEVDFFSTV